MVDLTDKVKRNTRLQRLQGRAADFGRGALEKLAGLFTGAGTEVAGFRDEVSKSLGPIATFSRNVQLAGALPTALAIGRIGGQRLAAGASNLAGRFGVGAGAASAIGLGVAGLTVASVAVVGALLTKMARDSAILATNVRAANLAFENLALRGGVDAVNLLEQIQESSGNTLTQLQALQLGSAALASGIPDLTANLGQLLTDVADIATLYGRDVAESQQRVIRAIRKGELRPLDELGIVFDRGEAYREYAKSVNVAVTSLTLLQQQEAFSIATRKEANRQAEESGRVYSSLINNTENAAKSSKDLSKAVSDLGLVVGEFTEEGFVRLNTILIATVNLLADMVRGLDKARIAVSDFVLSVFTTSSEPLSPQITSVVDNLNRPQLQQLQQLRSLTEEDYNNQIEVARLLSRLTSVYDESRRFYLEESDKILFNVLGVSDLSAKGVISNLVNNDLIGKSISQSQEFLDVQEKINEVISLGSRTSATFSGRESRKELLDLSKQRLDIVRELVKDMSLSGDLVSLGLPKDLSFDQLQLVLGQAFSRLADLDTEARKLASQYLVTVQQISLEKQRQNILDQYGLDIGGRILRNADDTKIILQAQQQAADSIIGSYPNIEATLGFEITPEVFESQALFNKLEDEIKKTLGESGANFNLGNYFGKFVSQGFSNAIAAQRNFFDTDFTQFPSFGGIDSSSLRDVFFTPNDIESVNNFVTAFRNVNDIINDTGVSIDDKRTAVQDYFNTWNLLNSVLQNYIRLNKDILLRTPLPEALRGLGPLAGSELGGAPQSRFSLPLTSADAGLNALRREFNLGADVFRKAFEFSPEQYNLRLSNVFNQQFNDQFNKIFNDIINNLELSDEDKDSLRSKLGLDVAAEGFNLALYRFGYNAREATATLIGDLALAEGSIREIFSRFAQNLVRSFARALVDYAADQVNVDRWRQILGTGASLVGRAFGASGTTNIGVQSNLNVQTSGQILDVNYINSQQDTTQQFPGG